MAETGILKRVEALRALGARACAREARGLNLEADPDAEVVLLLLMGHPAVSVRRAVLEALTEAETALHGPEARLALLAGLTDPDMQVRCRSMSYLPACRVPEDSLRIRPALADPEEDVRRAAALALGVYRDRGACELLAERLRTDESVVVRAMAATALALIGDRRAVPSLEAALGVETDGWVRVELVAALYRLGQRGRWKELLAFLREPGPLEPVMALSAIGLVLRPPQRRSAEAAIKALAEDESVWSAVREYAGDLLEILRDAELPIWPFRA